MQNSVWLDFTQITATLPRFGRSTGGGKTRLVTTFDERIAATCFIDGRTGACAGSVQVPGFVALIRGCPRLIVWLSSGLRGPGTAGQERLKKELLCSPLGVEVHEATLRVNVRWVTPLGDETASTS